jgi:hypothetical protein
MFKFALAVVAGAFVLMAVWASWPESPAGIVGRAKDAATGVAKELQGATSKTEAAKTQSPWQRRANALCRKEKRELEALGRPRTLKSYAPYLREAIALSRRYQARFEALAPPRELRAKVAKANDLADDGDALLVAMLRAAERRRPGELLDRAQEAMAFARRVNPLVLELGLTDCALPPTGLAA